MRKGQTVSWAWGEHRAHGRIVERFERKVQRTLKGTKVVRKGSSDNPAFLIQQEDGDHVLKLQSELD